MPAPIKIIAQNDPEIQGGSHQRSINWVVAFVSFEEPIAMYNNSSNYMDSKLTIIDNDCVSVSINNNKASFAKTAQIILKSTTNWYTGMVAPGDWMFVWINDDTNKIEQIIKKLKDLQSGIGGFSSAISSDNLLCNAASGLKFVGRVLKSYTQDSVSSNGIRSIMQYVDGQSFLEFATSIYYTYGATAFQSSAIGALKDGAEKIQKASAVAEQFITSSLDVGIKDLAQTFIKIYRQGKDFSPDTVVAIFMTLTMGVTAPDTDDFFNGGRGSASDAIKIPSLVGQILGRPKATMLWEILNAYFGVQQYDQGDLPTDPKTLLNAVVKKTPYGKENWWESFVPSAKRMGKTGFYRCPIRTEGLVMFRPQLWDNRSIWELMNENLNGVVNEMYTALRVDKDGCIRPTVIIREKPFSTGLINQFAEKGKINSISGPNEKVGLGGISIKPSDFGTQVLKQFSSNDSVYPKAGESIVPTDMQSPVTIQNSQVLKQKDLRNRTFFGLLPRWVIDESMILNFHYECNENARINFIQIWGSQTNAEWIGINLTPDELKRTQYEAGNYMADTKDIKRNGLRALTPTTPFDAVIGGKTMTKTPLWARMLADWYFNGHLKAVGSVTVVGVVDPIVEGDNCQIRGMVFHIDSVTHSATLSSNGQKSFTTTLQLSNGLLEKGLDDPKKCPLYPYHKGTERIDYDTNGITDEQISAKTNSLDISNIKFKI